MAIKNQERIIILWLVFLLGLLFHTDLGLMPLFHDLSVAESQAESLKQVAPIMWLMLAFFAVPMVAIIATALTEAKGYRQFHFGLTLVYTVLNIAHLVADLRIEPIIWYQITLMVMLLLIGLLLNRVSYDWLKERPTTVNSYL